MGFKDKVLGMRVKVEGQDEEFVCLQCAKFPEMVTKENEVVVMELRYLGQTATCDRCGRVFDSDNDFEGVLPDGEK